MAWLGEPARREAREMEDHRRFLRQSLEQRLRMKSDDYLPDNVQEIIDAFVSFLRYDVRRPAWLDAAVEDISITEYLANALDWEDRYA